MCTSRGGHTSLELVYAVVDNVGTTDNDLFFGRADSYIIASKEIISCQNIDLSCLTTSASSWKDKLPLVTLQWISPKCPVESYHRSVERSGMLV